MTIRNKTSVNEVLRKSMGGVTYYQCNGQSILRSKVSQNKSNTPLQQRQRKRWPEYSNLADACWDALEIGFPGRPQRQSAYNAFVRANKDAVSVDEQMNVTIEYEKVVCSNGKITTPTVSVTLNQEGKALNFTIQKQSFYGRRSLGNDEVYALIVEMKQQEGILASLGTREKCITPEVTLPSEWDTTKLAIYVFATTDDGRKASTSKYITLSSE